MHPFGHLLLDIDWGEIVADRAKQRAYLARYARQDWEATMTTPEITARVKLISEIVQKENAPAKTSSDE